MVCQKPHWNRDAVSNSWVWQDSWGAVTPRTPKENSATKQSIDGASLLLVHVTMNPNDTMTISSKNATRPMPQLCIAVQPPADAPLIENVPFCTQSFGSLLLTHAFHLSCDRSRVGILKDSKPTKSKMQAIGSHSTPLSIYLLLTAANTHTLSMYLQAPGVKVLSVLPPHHCQPAWSRSVAISSSNSIEQNPDEAFRGWDRSMGFSDTSQFLIVSRASCDAMKKLQPELVVHSRWCLNFISHSV